LSSLLCAHAPRHRGNRNVLTKLAELEHRLKSHDADIQGLMDAIRELMSPEEPNRRRIGFETPSAAGGKTPKDRTVQIRKITTKSNQD
jgi:hypothetical protein